MKLNIINLNIIKLNSDGLFISSYLILFLVICYFLMKYIFVNKIKQLMFKRFFEIKNKESTKIKHSCKNQLTSDPRIFGPEMWLTLHRIAANYPENPTYEAKSQLIAFINSLPYMVPCQHCGCHFLDFLEAYNLNNVVTSKKTIVKFFVDAHNNVNKNNGKPEWSVEDANIYVSENLCNDDRPVWKFCDIL